MDDERIDVVFSAFDVEQLDLVFIRRFGAPHARAGGKNLHGVGAKLMSVDGGTFQRSRQYWNECRCAHCQHIERRRVN